MLREIYYIYPIFNKVSFHYIAKKHIERLKKHVIVQEIDENVLDSIMWTSKKNILIHPCLYPLVGSSQWSYYKKIKRLPKLLEVKDKLGGFEVADTDKISDVAVKVLNHFDVIFVPSNFSIEVLKDSGVTTDVELLPHGLPDSFFTEDKTITEPSLKPLLELKEKDNVILVLFFLLHSGFRKGADLVYKVMSRVQQEYDNVYLVVKRTNLIDPLLHPLRKLKMIEIYGWLDEDGLRQLYDICDIVLCPSRGGGFELNALEGIARGIPTIVPKAGCFMDYIKYTIPVKVARWVRIFQDNIVHVGLGHECDLDDFHAKLCKTIDSLDKYKRKFRRYSKRVKEKYTWDNVAKQLLEYLEKYDFISI